MLHTHQCLDVSELKRGQAPLAYSSKDQLRVNQTTPKLLTGGVSERVRSGGLHGVYQWMLGLSEFANQLYSEQRQNRDFVESMFL